MRCLEFSQEPYTHLLSRILAHGRTHSVKQESWKLFFFLVCFSVLSSTVFSLPSLFPFILSILFFFTLLLPIITLLFFSLPPLPFLYHSLFSFHPCYFSQLPLVFSAPPLILSLVFQLFSFHFLLISAHHSNHLVRHL